MCRAIALKSPDCVGKILLWGDGQRYLQDAEAFIQKGNYAMADTALIQFVRMVAQRGLISSDFI